MKSILLLTLAASFVGNCYSQTIRPYQFTLSDTDVSLTVDDIGNGIYVRNSAGTNGMSNAEWTAGIRASNTSAYNATCYSYESRGIVLSAFSLDGTGATSVIVCNSSDLKVGHRFEKSASSQMIKGTIFLYNNGAASIPVVQYRRTTDYDVGDAVLTDCNLEDCTNNFLTTIGADGLANLVYSCFAEFSFYNDISSNEYTSCIANATATAVNTTADYSATYEFRFGPIAPQQNVSFYVFYGVSVGQEASYDELCKNKVEVASFFKPASSYLGLPYTYYVGYSGVGGNSSTFCSLSPSSGGGGGSSGGGASCFSGMNTVVEKSQGTTPITKLKIGDYVQTGTGSYTQVYGFGHLDHDREESFIQIHLDGDDSSKYEPYVIEISRKHLIFVDNAHDQAYPIRVENIVLGDVLNGRKVVKVSQVIRRGVYAPLTMSGDIMVSGVRVSNYVDLLEYSGWFSQHIIGHAVYTPRRIYCSHFMDLCMQETYHNGYGTYTQYIIKCASIVNDLGCVTIRTLSALVLLCGISLIYKFKGNSK